VGAGNEVLRVGDRQAATLRCAFIRSTTDVSLHLLDGPVEATLLERSRLDTPKSHERGNPFRRPRTYGIGVSRVRSGEELFRAFPVVVETRMRR
jgi:hypothetical protein